VRGKRDNGRRPAGDRADTRRRILDAAEALFAELGYEAASTRQVAERAGVSTGLIFYYFPTKEALFDALIADRNFAPQLQRILAGASLDDPAETLLRIGREFSELLRRRRRLARIVFYTTATDLPRRHFIAAVQASLKELARYLRSSLGPALDGGKAEAMAGAFVSSLIVNGLLMTCDDDWETLVRNTAAVLLHGYAGDRARGS